MKYYWVHYLIGQYDEQMQPFSMATDLHPSMFLEYQREHFKAINENIRIILASWQEITKAEYEAFNQ